MFTPASQDKAQRQSWVCERNYGIMLASMYTTQNVSPLAEPVTPSRYTVLAADASEATFAATMHQLVEDSPSRLVALYCRGSAEIVRALESYSRRQGSTVYEWTLDRGLISLREDGIVVPSSRRLAEALRYVQQSVHFGIYLIPIDLQLLTPPVIAQLRQLARANDGITKRVVLINEATELPASITEYCSHIQLQPRATAHLRLRDGRWVR
jgi:hypothetical protein